MLFPSSCRSIQSIVFHAMNEKKKRISTERRYIRQCFVFDIFRSQSIANIYNFAKRSMPSKYLIKSPHKSQHIFVKIYNASTLIYTYARYDAHKIHLSSSLSLRLLVRICLLHMHTEIFSIVLFHGNIYVQVLAMYLSNNFNLVFSNRTHWKTMNSQRV